MMENVDEDLLTEQIFKRENRMHAERTAERREATEFSNSLERQIGELAVENARLRARLAVTGAIRAQRR